LDQKIKELVAKKGVKNLLVIKIEQQQHSRKIRAYGDRPARVEITTSFQLVVSRDQKAIKDHKETLGWQVYATTTSADRLNFEACVWKYRQQNRVESRFHDLRNKVVPLLPIFLKKDHRIEALIHLLMICLKVCAMIEYKVARKLSQNREELPHIFEGNPKKSTPTPTAKRLLRTFRGISVVIMPHQAGDIPQVMITQLKQVQIQIIELNGFQTDIYTLLPNKIKLFFTQCKISEN